MTPLWPELLDKVGGAVTLSSTHLSPIMYVAWCKGPFLVNVLKCQKNVLTDFPGWANKNVKKMSPGHFEMSWGRFPDLILTFGRLPARPTDIFLTFCRRHPGSVPRTFFGHYDYKNFVSGQGGNGWDQKSFELKGVELWATPNYGIS